MIRNLKALALALCAVFMLGALSASTASAATDVLTSDAPGLTDTYVTGTQNGGIGAGNVFGTKSKAGKIECASGSYEGTFLGAPSEVELTPSYTGCKIGAANATVTNNGCKYVLTGKTEAFTNTSGVAEGEDATVSLNCGDTGSLVVDGPLGCQITFSDTQPANTKVNQNLLGARYDNEEAGGKKDIKATITVDKITYTSTGACQSLGFTASDGDGFFTTNVTLKGYADAGHTEQVDLSSS